MSKLSSDRGAITTIFAILLGSGVLLGIIALVIDGGQVMALKQLTRDAADSVAEAVAIHCAKDAAGTDCLNDNYVSTEVTNRTVMAQTDNASYLSALANPRGGGVRVTMVCGQTSVVHYLPACPPLTTDSTDCTTDLGADPSYTDWVRVYTDTGDTGYTPILSNLDHQDQPSSYAEYGCAQVYWGQPSAISVQNQLPFLVGACEARTNGVGQFAQLIGEAAGSACSYSTAAGATVAASTRGFRQFEPLSNSGACWTEGGGTCVSLSLNNTKAGTGIVYPALTYSGLIGAMKAKLNKPVLLPLVDAVAGGYQVRGFTQFTMVGFKFPSTSTINACTANSYCSRGTNYYMNYTWTGACAATQSTSSPYCIAGFFSTKAVTANGQTAGQNLTTATNIVNLGYQVIRHIE